MQAAGQGQPGIMGKKKRSNPGEASSKPIVKNFPDSRQCTRFAGTEAILLGVLFLREAKHFDLDATAQPLGLLMESLPLILLPLCPDSVHLHVFFLLFLSFLAKNIS